MENIIDPFREEFIEQELGKMNKRRVRVMLVKLCGGGNLKFTNVCIDSSFPL